MTRPVTALVAILGLTGGALQAQPPSREAVLSQALSACERVWKAAEKPEPGLTSRDLFACALVLCEARQCPERLPRLMDLATQMQDRDPQSPTYGNFRWYWREDRIGDWNAVDFCMRAGPLMWLRHRDWIPQEAREKLAELLRYATDGCLRHRVGESYTNIAIMNAGDLILLGEALDRPEVADEGYARLQRVFLYTREYGIHEFCSPTYYGTNLDGLYVIEAFCRREEGREQARALLELIWTDIALNWFPAPPQGKLAGAHSRSYDYTRGLGYLDAPLWVAGWLEGPPTGGTDAIFSLLGNWRPPESLRELCATRFPRTVRQRWGDGWAQCRIHHLVPDVTLSVACARYGGFTDMPLTVDLPGERTAPRCYFIADGRGDPYGKVRIVEGPHQKALHLDPSIAATQRTTDAVLLVVYPDSAIPRQARTLESHFVIPRDVDSLWIGEQSVSPGEVAAGGLPVAGGTPVVFRKGTAAVGVRVLWARDTVGGAATVALVDDGNALGVRRITVTHHRGEPPEFPTQTPAAVLWVRVGSGLGDERAFAAWRQAFSGAAGQVQASQERIGTIVQGRDGPLQVEAAASWGRATRLDPAPTRAILELDGEDLGKAILGRVRIAGLTPEGAVQALSLPAGQALYIEAEAGQVMPPMVVAKDAAASGGRYVWMPGEAGARGGSALGSLKWRLQVDRAGTYYLWGRVLAPTPDDDSFYVRTFTPQVDILDRMDWMTGTHTQWEWTPFCAPGSREPFALDLPTGEVFLQLGVREDGTKVDRVFLTPRAEARP